jgi:hypothetical protein
MESDRIDIDYGSTKLRKKARLRTLADLDHRTLAAKRASALVAAFETDLGGADRISTAQRELCRRAAILGALIEDAEVAWIKRERFALADYLGAVNSQRRVLQTIGLQRHAHVVNGDDDETMRLYEKELAEFGDTTP